MGLCDLRVLARRRAEVIGVNADTVTGLLLSRDVAYILSWAFVPVRIGCDDPSRTVRSGFAPRNRS